MSYKHFEGLFELISKIYDENPSATWFTSKPSREIVEALLAYKLAKIKDNDAVDYVALEDEKVIGECEIIKDKQGNGWVGIMVDKDFRKRRIGSALLKRCIKNAKKIGIKRVFAEVACSNSAVEFFKKNNFEVRGIENREKGRIVLLELFRQ